jgi:hypothetical protein
VLPTEVSPAVPVVQIRRMLGWGEARDDLRVPRAPFAHLDLIERHRLHGPRRQGGRDGHQVSTRLAAVGGGAIVIDALDLFQPGAIGPIDVTGDLARPGDPQRAVRIFI